MVALPGRRCVALAGVLLASGALADLTAKFTDSLVDDGQKASLGRLIAEGGGIATKSCGTSADALAVQRIEVEPNALAAVIHGALSRPLHGGMVRAKLNLQKPEKLTVAQHFKFLAATAFTRSRKFSEPLCKHLGLTKNATGGAASSEDGCTIPAGERAMRLAFKGMPQLVFVGKYDLEIHVVDEKGLPVACVHGSMAVKPGKSKGLIRKLSVCDDLWMVNDNRHYIEKAYVSYECENEGKVNFNFEMMGDPDFYLEGNWFEYCNDNDNTELHMWKRHPDAFSACDPTGADPCGHVMCSGKVCREDKPGVYECQPEGTQGLTGGPPCEEYAGPYYIHPDTAESVCWHGDVTAGASRPGLAAAPAALAAALLGGASAAGALLGLGA